MAKSLPFGRRTSYPTARRIMKLNKTALWIVSVAMMASAATFAFAAPQSTTTSTTKTKKTRKSKTTETTATTATTAATPAAAPASAPAATKAKGKSEATPNATPAQISAAKAAGQVWVNTGTKVYHDSSSQFYGATKAGKFMSEKDAIAAGYHKAKNGD